MEKGMLISFDRTFRNDRPYGLFESYVNLGDDRKGWVINDEFGEPIFLEIQRWNVTLNDMMIKLDVLSDTLDKFVTNLTSATAYTSLDPLVTPSPELVTDGTDVKQAIVDLKDSIVTLRESLP